VPVASILSSITELLTDTVGDYGLYAIFFLMLVDAVFPAASEPVMVYGGAVAAGAFAGQDIVFFGHELEPGFPAFVAVATAGTLGYLVGSLLGWWIGAAAGRPFLERHGRWLHLNAAKLEKAEQWFDRWDEWAVFLGRITPVARSFISIPAGVFRMPLGRYTLLTLLGSALWCFPLAGIGWALGANWEEFHHAFHYVDYAIVALVIAAAAFVGWRLLRRRRRSRTTAGQPELD
jgi:membrane protein DedA with SNARE-associated domain